MNNIFLMQIYIEFGRRLLIKNEFDAANIKWRLDEAAGQLGLAIIKLQGSLHHEL